MSKGKLLIAVALAGVVAICIWLTSWTAQARDPQVADIGTIAELPVVEEAQDHTLAEDSEPLWYSDCFINCGVSAITKGMMGGCHVEFSVEHLLYQGAQGGDPDCCDHQYPTVATLWIKKSTQVDFGSIPVYPDDVEYREEPGCFVSLYKHLLNLTQGDTYNYYFEASTATCSCRCPSVYHLSIYVDCED